MKAKSRARRKRSGLIKREAQLVPLTPEQLRTQAEWNRLTKYPEYWAKRAEAKDADKVFHQTIRALHDLMAFEESFARNTPFPFKVAHWSYVAMIAATACRYLQRLARLDNHDAIKTLAHVTVEMTETLTELLYEESPAAKRNTELVGELVKKFGNGYWHEEARKTKMALMRHVARELPYWPVLYCKNRAANNHLPDTIDELEIGKECPINVSQSAKFSLRTPLNALLWKCIRHFQRVHWSIRIGFAGPGVGHVAGPAKTFEKAIAPMVYSQHKGRRSSEMIPREEIPIYRKSFYLPPLTNSATSAKQWADVAVVPFVQTRFPEQIHPGKSGRPRRGDFRKKVIQQLRQIARKVDGAVVKTPAS